MIKVGLTGSIGMGKSATAAMFAARGVPVFDADAAVHSAYAKGGEAVPPLEWAFPGVTTKKGDVDRKLLRERVVGDPAAMKKLESIIHPIVNGYRKAFLETAEKSGADIVVLDVPLLFETGGHERVDAVVVVSAPEDLQRRRVLARGGMTEAELDAIIRKQTPDSEKRRRADFVVNTAFGLDYAQAQVDAILAALRDRAGPGDSSCAKSPSTRKQPDSAPTRATGLSKSAASN